MKKKDQTKQPRVQKERTKMLCKEVRLTSFAAQFRHWGSRTSSHKVKNVFTFVR